MEAEVEEEEKQEEKRKKEEEEEEKVEEEVEEEEERKKRKKDSGEEKGVEEEEVVEEEEGEQTLISPRDSLASYPISLRLIVHTLPSAELKVGFEPHSHTRLRGVWRRSQVGSQIVEQNGDGANVNVPGETKVGVRTAVDGDGDGDGTSCPVVIYRCASHASVREMREHVRARLYCVCVYMYGCLYV